MTERQKVLAAGILASAVCGVMYAWSVFVLPLEHLFGWTRQTLSFTFTLVFISFSCGMFLGGILSRRCGPGKTVLLGSAVLAGGLWTASCASSPMELYAGYGLLAGLGIGVINIVPTAVCLSHYPEKKGLIGGVLTMALAFGTLVFGSFGASILMDLFGVMKTFGILAVVLPLSAGASALFLRFPEGGTSAGEAEKGMTLGETVRTGTYRSLWLWMFLIQTGGLMVIGHLVPLAFACGMEGGVPALMLSLYSVCNGLGRPLFGALHDRLGFRASLGMDSLLMMGGLAALLCCTKGCSVFTFAVGTAAVGLSYGGCVPQLAAMCMSFFGSRNFGAIYGFSTTPSMTGSLFGPFAAGVLFSLSGSYSTPLVCGALLAAASVPVLYVLSGKARKLLSLRQAG